MPASFLVLPPCTPAAFLSHILDGPRHHPPTTVLICAARSDFLRSAVSQLHDQPLTTDVLRATLARVATARRVQVAFAPSVASLRAYLSVLLPTSRLLVYGFLDVHRGGGGGGGAGWSAQAIGCSAACLVEAAARGGMEAVMLEPTGWEEGDEAREEEDDASKEERWVAYEEQIPLLSSTAEAREDGTWGVPCTSARVILQRWFTFDDS